MAVTGCVFVIITCPCIPAQRRRDRQLLPACGLQEPPIQNPKHRARSKPNTSRLPITPGGNLGSGHFYLAENRTFLLCVDSRDVFVEANPFRRSPRAVLRNHSRRSRAAARLRPTARSLGRKLPGVASPTIQCSCNRARKHEMATAA